MHGIDAFSGGTELNEKSKIEFENPSYNIINGETIFTNKRSSGNDDGSNKETAEISGNEPALLAIASSAARNALSGWVSVPLADRKAILSSWLKKIDEHADELSARLSVEQRVKLAEAKWEIYLLTRAFGPVLMQMETAEKRQDVQTINRITKRYVPIAAGATLSPSSLPAILSFGKVLPALLAGETLVLRPSPYAPLTVRHMSEYLRELAPPGVFNLLTGDLWPGMRPHSG